MILLPGNDSVYARLDRLLAILLLPGLIAVIYLVAGRLQIERSSRDVELTLDYDEIQNLSITTGLDVPSILEQFKLNGITAAAINEQTVGNFINTGQIQCRVSSKSGMTHTMMEIQDQDLADRLYTALKMRLPANRLEAIHSNGSDYIVDVVGSPAALMGIGIGLPDKDVATVQAAGLDVIARLQNNPTITAQAIDASLDELKRQRITHIIFGGEEVLGFRGLVPHTAERIISDGLVYGSIEFAKQRGDATLCEKLKGNYVRVHSIPVSEMAGMAPSTAVERFARAVKERSIRICYVRLISTSGEDPLNDNSAFIKGISNEVQKAGFSLGIAKPFAEHSRPLWAMILIAISIVSGGVLLINSFMSLSPSVKYGLLIIGSILGILLVIVAEKGRQGMALLSALIFPTLGVMVFAGRYFECPKIETHALRKAILAFIGISGYTILGAAMIVGLLADRSYVVKLNQYVGIKPSTILPVLLIAFAICAGLPIFNKSYAQVKEQVCSNLRRLVTNPVLIWHVIAAIVALAIVGLAVLRSGNDPGVGVSSIELRLRSMLDKVLIVRPRTKEFMFGHPALIVGIGLLLKRNRGWGLPLVAFGVIGQTSLLNTFCHIHTPLWISILRTFNGLWIGLLIAIVIWFIIDKLGSNASDNR